MVKTTNLFLHCNKYKLSMSVYYDNRWYLMQVVLVVGGGGSSQNFPHKYGGEICAPPHKLHGRSKMSFCVVIYLGLSPAN